MLRKAVLALVVASVALPQVAQAWTWSDVRDRAWQAAEPALQDPRVADRLPALETPPAVEDLSSSAQWYLRPARDGTWWYALGLDDAEHGSGPSRALTGAISVDATARAEPGWREDTEAAALAAGRLLRAQAGLDIARWWMVETGDAGPALGRCDLDRAAHREASFYTPADLVVVVSAGNLDGHWGESFGSLTEGWPAPSCPADGVANGAATTLPTSYVRLDPLGYAPRVSMQHLMAHELGHLFGMEHSGADCQWTDGRLQRTLEAFSNADDLPPACGSPATLDTTSLFRFSDATAARLRA